MENIRSADSRIAGDARRRTEYIQIVTAVLVVCSILPFGFVLKWAMTPETLFPDFFGFWSFGRYVLTHTPATIYDQQALHAFQTDLGMSPRLIYPFPYPPCLLLLLAPFGAIPYALAHISWLVVTFSGYITALTAWRWQRAVTALLVLSPSSAVCFLVGQNGFLTAGLMLGGIRLLPTQPLAAGALLATVGYKPQFAIFVPFMLLFGRHWRAMLGAALSATAVSVLTTVVFGGEIWMGWIACMQDQATALISGRDTLLDMMPTVTSSVRLLGGSVMAGRFAQIVAALLALLALWHVRTRHDVEAQAVLPLVTILGTPYAFHYDLVLTTGAALSVIAARIASGQNRNLELPVLLACVMTPSLSLAHIGMAAAIIPVVFTGCLCTMLRKPVPSNILVVGFAPSTLAT